MSTAAQQTANRANATHSTGPRTEAGKDAVRQNSTTHGLASSCLLSYESAADFAEIFNIMIDENPPNSETEFYLTRQMAQARWRIFRIDRLLNATFDFLIGAADPECPDVKLAESMIQLGGDPIAKLHRYHNDAERSYYKAKRELENTQKAFKTAKAAKNGAKPIAPPPELELEAPTESDADFCARMEARMFPDLVAPAVGCADSTYIMNDQ